MASTLVLALLSTLQLTASQNIVPYCLENCLEQANTDLCHAHALSDLQSCITKECLNPPATQNLIANLGVTYSPKLEYSCQQSVLPGTNDDSVTLPLNQSCSTSPYEFQSFVPSASSAINAANGCRILVYSEEECLGEAMSVDIGTVDGGRCIFHGGRSARLTCNNELDAARAFIEKECNSADDDSSASSSSSSAPSYGSSSSSSTTTSASTESLASSTLAGPVTNSASTSDSPSRTTHYMSMPTSSSFTNATVPIYGNTTSAVATELVNPTDKPLGTTTGSDGVIWFSFSFLPSTTAAGAVPTYTGGAAQLGLGAPLAVVGALLALA